LNYDFHSIDKIIYLNDLPYKRPNNYFPGKWILRFFLTGKYKCCFEKFFIMLNLHHLWSLDFRSCCWLVTVPRLRQPTKGEIPNILFPYVMVALSQQLPYILCALLVNISK
jgi:hypothetical protein